MSAFLDSSVLVAALAPDEAKHADCLTLLLKADHSSKKSLPMKHMRAMADDNYRNHLLSLAG